MKHFLTVKNLSLTSKLTLLVIMLLFIAIGVTINDGLKQKNITTNASELPTQTLNPNCVEPTCQPTTAIQPTTIIIEPPADYIAAPQNNGIENRFFDFLKKILETVR